MQREVELAAVARVRDDLAYHDELTGVGSRRLLSGLLGRWWSETVEQCGRLALLMIDLDGFKEINDRHGHLVGDRVLRAVANMLVEHFRSNDVVVRYGGDEFVVLLPGAGAEEAGELGRRAREALARHPLLDDRTQGDSEIGLSFSVGVAAYPDDGASGSEILARADRRLYQEKQERQGGARARRRRRRRVLWWSTVAVLTLATAVVTAVVVLQLTERTPRVSVRAEPAEEAAEGAVQASRREELLQAEIDALRTEIAALEQRAEAAESRRRAAEPTPPAATVERLQQRVELLEGMLAATPNPVVQEDRPDLGPTPRAGGSQEAPAPTATPPAAGEKAEGGEATPVPVPPELAPPVLQRVPAPEYPEWARRFRRHATVRLRVVVSPAGRVLEAEVVSDPAGFGFDAAARKAALGAVFEPATVDGEPVRAEAMLVVRFDLSDSGR